ncbi:hypothetical protein BKA62DRAFT_208419 [Auriculariales sp. MPI-PUGE-AT-0066]|nr:hypothetical protein BKA62DRAFT_208419 [Auriculariales sp. MPI-PUGE-AT-0066]
MHPHPRQVPQPAYNGDDLLNAYGHDTTRLDIYDKCPGAPKMRTLELPDVESASLSLHNFRTTEPGIGAHSAELNSVAPEHSHRSQTQRQHARRESLSARAQLPSPPPSDAGDDLNSEPDETPQHQRTVLVHCVLAQTDFNNKVLVYDFALPLSAASVCDRTTAVPRGAPSTTPQLLPRTLLEASATRPEMRRLLVVIAGRWSVVIEATRWSESPRSQCAVTVGDVLLTVHQFLHEPVDETEVGRMSFEQRSLVLKKAVLRQSRSQSARSVLRIDCLLGRSQLRRVELRQDQSRVWLDLICM